MAVFAIHGSCVSRDAFSGQNAHQVSTYVARSSLASGGAAKSELLVGHVTPFITSIDSAFQRRMVGFDIEKTGLAEVAGAGADCILLDLIDERFSLYVGEMGVATLSNELRGSGVSFPSSSIVRSGEEGHWECWQKGVDAFVSAVSGQRVIINMAYWAAQTIDGEPLDNAEYIRSSNDYLRKMYDELGRKLPADVIEYPEDLLVADPRNKWGLSPFHYCAAFYSHTIIRLEQLLGT